MNETDGIPDMGPLPQSDENAQLQGASLKALNAFLQHQDAILFRDQRTEDYGVDGSFELKISGCMTNFQSQVQLKGTASAKPNKDGSISLSVRTANLNYLLNGSSPLYLLFDAERKEFWYVWAQDEFRRITATNPSWREQGTVTIQFTERLYTDSLDTIVARILAEGRMHRQIRDSLARSTTNDPIVVRIDAESFEVTDPAQAQSILIASGPTIVAAGYPAEALRLLDLIDSRVKAMPRLQYVAAYAEYMIGRHYNALGHIRQAKVRSQELSANENVFLDALKDTCEFRVGLIGAERYLDRSDKRTKSLGGIWLLRERLETTFNRFLGERDSELRSRLTEEARKITDEISGNGSASEVTKLRARVILLYIEGANVTIASAHQMGMRWMREHIPAPYAELVAQGNQTADSQLAEWVASANIAFADACRLGHPFLIAEASLAWLGVHLRQLLNQRIDAMYRDKPFEVPHTFVSHVQKVIKDTSSVYERAQSVEGRLRLDMFNADFLEITGDLSRAKALAARIYPEAEAMALGDIADRARELLEDRTLLMEFEKEDARVKGMLDDDIWFANLTDEELGRFARDNMQSLGLPPERFQVIERYCHSLRDVARERRHWCRHLEVKEDLTQTLNPTAAFVVLPNRLCVCGKLGYKTKIASTDVLTLLGTFKNMHCEGCKERSPLQE